MDDEDDALPPPIRRSPRAVLQQRQTALREAMSADNHLDEAAPVISYNRSVSLESRSIPQANSRVNPLASHPVASGTAEREYTPGVADFSRHRFSHPFWEELKPFQVEAPRPSQPAPPPVPRRSPAKLKSYRTNKRLPPHLNRRTSLETIASVTTTQSLSSDEEEQDPPEASTPSQHSFTLEDDGASTPVPSDVQSLASSMRKASLNSLNSYDPAVVPVLSPALVERAQKSLFRKVTNRKSNEPTAVADHLTDEKNTSVLRTSQPLSFSESTQSLPVKRTASLERCNTERSQSGSSSGWSASNFDMSTLSEAEIKKCKKKGINPALYAEMRAARKGKWTSPIVGNTFL
ncbi:hypothetical protein HBI80_122990 [Parastagonospora nodorum]|nr:hypothetical protein HBH42_075750 [Parastagonospora nodorum]KAH4902944.1 hypothetical protein HBI80_122990 [Parastagonospora nodorum]